LTREAASLVVFLVAAGWMQVGPVVRQVLKAPLPPMAMAWQMYHGRGIDVCAVSWYTAQDGELAPLDRISLLGDGKGVEGLPAGRRRLRSRRQVRTEAQALCRALDADVRADAWCGRSSDGRFQPALSTEEALCPGR
jgi:hypothetical protein